MRIAVQCLDAMVANRGVKSILFFSSSVCIYRDMIPGDPEITEAGAYPAAPNNEYGWEKLYAERTAMALFFGLGRQRLAWELSKKRRPTDVSVHPLTALMPSAGTNLI